MPPEYRIGYGDVIEIKFFYDPELNELLTVRPDGRITLPRLGDVFVVGKTPMELDEIVTAKSSEILKRPEVTVTVREFASHTVFVLGEVNLPGGYPLQGSTTALQAIALAGGLKKSAESKSVMIIRSDPGPELRAIRLNLAPVLSGKHLEGDMVVLPQDIIYVPNTFIDRVNTFVDQFFATLLPPLNFYLTGYDVLHPERGYRVYGR
jgi:protein involved in polysaccharide export with SLBB domain